MVGSEWPGNVRELENAVEHALTVGSGTVLRIPDLPPHIAGMVGKMGYSEPVGEGRTLKEIERRHILCILEETRGNHARAAEILGIDRRTLYRQLDRYKSKVATAAAPDERNVGTEAVLTRAAGAGPG